MKTNVAFIELRGNAWVGKAGNGEIVVRGEDHTSAADARRAAEGVFPGVEIREHKPPRKYDVVGIPETEPIFTVRGQDKLALSALKAYIRAYDEHLMDVEDDDEVDDDDFITSLRELQRDFMDFADTHPDQMKFPD